MNQEEIMQQLQAAVQAYQSKDLDAEAIFKQILAVNQCIASLAIIGPWSRSKLLS